MPQGARTSPERTHTETSLLRAFAHAVIRACTAPGHARLVEPSSLACAEQAGVSGSAQTLNLNQRLSVVSASRAPPSDPEDRLFCSMTER